MYAITRDTYYYDESHEYFGYRLLVFRGGWKELANETEDPVFADALSDLGESLAKLYDKVRRTCLGSKASNRGNAAIKIENEAGAISVEDIRAKEEHYLLVIKNTHVNSAEAISAFHEWYSSARILFDRHVDPSDREFVSFCNVDTSGNGYSLSHIYHRIYSSYSVLLDRIIRNEKRKIMLKTEQKMLSKEIFIVHGHDSAMKESVKSLILRLGLKPIVLADAPNEGRTIIEKFEANTQNIDYAVVLLSDEEDWGRAHNERRNKPRARQNVILELGYFIGKLSRKRVCVLKKKNVETPSDILGVGYIEYIQDSKDWQIRMADELASVGYIINKNLI